MKWYHRWVYNGEVDPSLILFSEVAWFHIHEWVNCQNNRFWPAKNPMLLHKEPLLDVMGRCAMSARILGPIIFLTLYIHTDISRIFWHHLLNSCPIRGNLYFSFQQSSALTQTANNYMRCLYSVFDNKIISRGMCSPRSSDLNPRCQFLRVGHIAG
jgi:hypothetical protein